VAAAVAAMARGGGFFRLCPPACRGAVAVAALTMD